MKRTRRTITMVLALAMCLTLCFGMTACGNGNGEPSSAPGSADGTTPGDSTPTVDPAEVSQEPTEAEETVKIGVLVSDATSSEALGFKAYYKEYIESNYNVQLLYSEEVADANAEKSAIENFVTNNCKAVISFASADRPAQIQQCEAAGVYYAVATGTLTDEEYEIYKSYKYYVGAIGPDLATEYQTGYDMAKHYARSGMTSFAIFGAGIGYYIDMHIYRTAGMLAALCEDEGTSYGGAKDFGDIVGKIYADGTIKPEEFVSETYTFTAYHELWNFDDAAWQSNMAALVASAPEVLMCAGTGFAVFGASVIGTDIEIADIDSYTDENGQAMDAGVVDYLAGKFSSSIGPIFIATLNAVNGNAIRGADDTALALGQGYWVASSSEQFAQYMAADTAASPAYSAEVLNIYLGANVSYDDFAEFVSQYSFEEISSMK